MNQHIDEFCTRLVDTVLFTALSLVAFVGLSILGARIYYDWEIHGPVSVAPQTFGKPRLQIDD